MNAPLPRGVCPPLAAPAKAPRAQPPAWPRLLVSVRDAAEALQAAAAGVDLIDAKEPADGALGAVPAATLRELVAALRAAGHAQPVSATVGDGPFDEAELEARVRATAACGVQWVKVGAGPDEARSVVALGRLQARLRAEQAAAEAAGRPRPLPAWRGLVPVLLADAGLDSCRLNAALRGGFPAVMLDTADKRGGSLLARRPAAELQAFVQAVQAGGAWAGLAGSLRLDELPALRGFGTDLLGFRGAACGGERSGRLDAGRLAALRAALRPATGRDAGLGLDPIPAQHAAPAAP